MRLSLSFLLSLQPSLDFRIQFAFSFLSKIFSSLLPFSVSTVTFSHVTCQFAGVTRLFTTWFSNQEYIASRRSPQKCLSGNILASNFYPYLIQCGSDTPREPCKLLIGCLVCTRILVCSRILLFVLEFSYQSFLVLPHISSLRAAPSSFFTFES